MKLLINAMAVLVVFLGCATINYIGESYPPTQDVDVYYSEQDIEKEYTVVGRIVATANANELIYSSEKFTQALVKKAREKGADGVVILGLRKIISGVRESGSGVEVEEKRRIEALAIKYKSNINETVKSDSLKTSKK